MNRYVVQMALGFAVVALGAWAATRFVGTEPAWKQHAASDDPDLIPIRIDDPARHYREGGFVELMTPIAPPTKRDGSDKIEVFLRIPDGEAIDPSLRLPPGSVADRVESLALRGGGWTVGDIRGARIGEDGTRWLRLLRPERAGPGSPLVGYEWPEDRADLGRLAHARLAGLMRAGGGAVSPRGDRESMASLFMSRGDCLECHGRDRPLHRRMGQPGPFGPTDPNGFYTPAAVLRDWAPLERYRPRDLNHLREHVRIDCGGEPAARREDGRGAVWFECQDGSVPIGRIDLAAALAAGNRRAAGTCRARRYLLDRMSPEARPRFSALATECADRAE